MSKKKRKSQELLNWIELITGSYLFVMLGIFPLFYQNNYYDIADVKYRFFRLVTLILLIYLAVVKAGGMLLEGKKAVWRPRWSVLDLAVLAYVGACVLSWLLSPYRAEAWIGCRAGWYMGLLSQLLFVGAYFCLSRHGIDREWPLWVLGISSVLVFTVAYLQRFGIDPLGLQRDFSEETKRLFLGTIGQATFYSSYVCVVLPVLMGVYLTACREQTKTARGKRILLGATLFAGFCTAVTQNSDSAFVGLGLAFLFLLWPALEELFLWKRYVEIGLIAVLAAKVTGILQSAFPERVTALDPLSLTVSGSVWGWYVLAAGLVCYAVTCWAAKKYEGRPMPGLRRAVRCARVLFYALIAATVLLVILMIWGPLKKEISAEPNVLQQSGYMEFNEDWGNGRGRNWMHCAKVYREYPVLRKLVGCGPDVLASYTTEHYADEIHAMWGPNSINPNAHNEWLTALLDYGILGALAYVSVFILALVRSLRYWRKRPVLLAAGAAVLSYVGHNMFCYQQVTCTSLIFIVIGSMEYLIRRTETAVED